MIDFSLRFAEENNIKKCFQNLKKNIALLISLAGLLAMYLTRSTMLLLVLCAIAGCTFVMCALDMVKPPLKHDWTTRLSAMLMAIPILIAGYNTMCKRWAESDKLDQLAFLLKKDRRLILALTVLLLGVIGFYSLYVFCSWIELVAIQYVEGICKGKNLLANLKSNFIFLLSAGAFFSMNASVGNSYAFAWGMAFILILVISFHAGSIWRESQKQSIKEKVYSILTACGICWGQKAFFWNSLDLGKQLPDIIGSLGAVLACYFVYICILMFCREIKKTRLTSVFLSITPREAAVYIALFAIGAIYIIGAFTQSQAFYKTPYSYDIIYTSDSPELVKSNIYLTLSHGQNDLRQPLFALFAAPLMGIPYLLTGIFGLTDTASAILIDFSQLALLMVGNFLLAEIVCKTKLQKICFMILCNCTYTYLLFTLMMEQYIVGYFWLMLLLYSICQKEKSEFTYLAASGSMLTDVVLLPEILQEKPVYEFEVWLKSAFATGMKFISLIFVFGRFDVFYNLGENISMLNAFGGKTISFPEKIWQYTIYIKNCLFTPLTMVMKNSYGQMSIQLQPAKAVSVMGILILLLMLLSAIVNRKNKSARLAAAWLLFSVVMLVGLGWGTMENGLILYSLYFGWPVLMLLFQLTVWIGERLHKSWFVPAVSAIAAAGLLAVNVPGVCQLMNFAITYYPA